MSRSGPLNPLREIPTIRRLAGDRRWFRPNDATPADLLRESRSWRVTTPLRTATVVRAELGALRSGDRTARVAALRSRLLGAAPYLAPDFAPGPAASTRRIADALISRAVDVDDKRFWWLLVVAASGTMPDPEDLVAIRRAVLRATPRHRSAALIDNAVQLMLRDHSHFRDLDIVTGGVVVDVDFCASHGFMSGVQRVVRAVLARWRSHPAVTLVGWDALGSGMRRLDERERSRVVDWSPTMSAENSYEGRALPSNLLVPWESTVFLPEVAQGRFAARLACLAEWSGNRVVAIGYDAIPATRGFFVSPHESGDFAAYLRVIKHADAVLAISSSAAEEFGGFVDGLAAQGLVGPAVVTESLPDSDLRPPAAGSARWESSIPVVLSVGSHERRKNHIAVVDAAEVLWRKGLRFSLLLAGGRGPAAYRELARRVAQLALEGRPVTMAEGIDDGDLERAYALSRFQVFVSRHEGYGLPVVESLAAGTPVITSDRGSLAEIAESGGCVTVDPDDVDAIASQMERLLTQDSELDRLHRQIELRRGTTWDDYAFAVWRLVRRDR